MGLSSTRGFAGGAAAAAGSFMDRKRKGAVASSKSKRPRAQERYEPPGVARSPRARALARARRRAVRAARRRRARTPPPAQVFSRQDSAPELSLSRDQLTVTGDKGFRMTRATHGAREGGWYWECEILHPENEKGHVRCVANFSADARARRRAVTREARTFRAAARARSVGWAQRSGELQAPVGYDKWSYAYRDLQGSKLHNSVRIDGFGEPFGERARSPTERPRGGASS